MSYSGLSICSKGVSRFLSEDHREDVVQVISQIEGVRRFRDTLVAQGHAVRYNEFDGRHDYACWNKTLADAHKWGLPLPASGQIA